MILASQFLLDGTWRTEVIIEAPAALREVDRSFSSSSLPWWVKSVPDSSFWPNSHVSSFTGLRIGAQ